MTTSTLSPRSFHDTFGLNTIKRKRHVIILLILAVALVAFEIFNFDSTQYALHSFLGNVRFAGVLWSTVLAVAFCGIDFAGLLHIFAPQTTRSPLPEQWYLMCAWLLGATMNAVMTWYAVALTLLQHPVGNEVLSRDDILTLVPVFVAVLVWLTRILFIGALSLMNEVVQLEDDDVAGNQRAYIRPHPDRD